MITIVRTVAKFLEAVKKDVGSDRRLPFYRGQADLHWKCVPSIARGLYGPKAIYRGQKRIRQSAEWVFFARFRDVSASLEPPWVSSSTPVENDWRRLILARHHGIPTRLLDWTSKPLVALYFCVRGPDILCSRVPCVQCGGRSTRAHPAGVFVWKKEQSHVFTLNGLARDNKRPPYYEGKDEPGIFIPPDILQRVSAQGSVFTIGKAPRNPVVRKPTIIVPAKSRTSILAELHRLGITEASMFPDLDGIGRWLVTDSENWGPERGVDGA